MKAIAKHVNVESRVQVFIYGPNDSMGNQWAQTQPSPTYDWPESVAQAILWSLCDQFPNIIQEYIEGKDAPK